MPIRKPLPRRTAIALFIAITAIFLCNLRNVGTGDTVAVRYVPFALLTRGTLHVDGYIEKFTIPYLEGKLPYGVYFASQSRGHWMSNYPILTPIAVTPLYVPAAYWVTHKHIQPGSDAMDFVALAMEKISAALIAALGVVLVYLALNRVVASRTAIGFALVYALASPTWEVSSQALWLHGVTELGFAMMLWALLSDDGSRRAAAWLGLAMAIAVANKLTNAVVAFPILGWFCWKELRGISRRIGSPADLPNLSGESQDVKDLRVTVSGTARVIAIFLPLVAIGLLVLGYNLFYFGNIFGAYDAAFKSLGYSGIGSGFHGNIFTGIAGMLVSPSRGLFIYVPWAVFSIVGMAMAWRGRKHGWEPWLVIGTILHFLMYAKLERWYAGYSYGPRYMTDTMPLFVFFLVPIWERAAEDRSSWLKPVLVATIAYAFFVQGIGAFCYPNGDWNTVPESVDIAPQRVWDWRDPQILRTLRAGPAHTKILDHLRGNHQQN